MSEIREIIVTQNFNELGHLIGTKIVPLVRCKDCKHSAPWYRDKARCFLWHEEGIGVFEDGYCNYGERKEQGHECGKSEEEKE